MRLERRAGTTVLTGVVRDQAALVGLVERVQDLGLELVSLQPADAAGDADASPGETGATHGAGLKSGTPSPRRRVTPATTPKTAALARRARARLAAPGRRSPARNAARWSTPRR